MSIVALPAVIAERLRRPDRGLCEQARGAGACYLVR